MLGRWQLKCFSSNMYCITGMMQVSEKYENIMQKREADEEEQKRHFQSWETYWGRPGYGAPR